MPVLDLVPCPPVCLARLQPVVERFAVTAPCCLTAGSTAIERNVEQPALRTFSDGHVVVQQNGYVWHRNTTMSERLVRVRQSHDNAIRSYVLDGVQFES